MSRPLKRSLTLHGHATSVSLEPDFWRVFQALAQERGMAVNALAAQIDEQRGPATGLATAIRLFVLRELEAKLSEARDVLRAAAQRASCVDEGGIE